LKKRILSSIIGKNLRQLPFTIFWNENKKEKYLNLIQSDKRLLLNFINEISNKSQLLSKRIWFNFTHKTIEEKILSYINENAKNNKIKFLPSISALAKKFEVTRPALSREISNLCKKKILTKIENTNDTL